MINSAMAKQHLSARIYLGYILYLQEFHPEIDLEKLCRDCGLSFDYIKNQNNWVSVTFDYEFMKKLREILKNDQLEFEVGAYSVSRKCIGPFYVLGQYVVTLSGLYTQVVSYGPRLNRVVNFEVLRHKGRKVVLKISPKYDGLTPEECVALDQIFPSIVQSMRGYYAAFPKIKKLPFAKVEITSDQKSVDFHVSYPIDPIGYVQKAALALLGPTFFGLSWMFGLSVLSAWALTATLFLCFTAIFLFRRNQGLEDLSDENQMQNRHLNETNKQLQEANSFLQEANTDLKKQVAVSSTASKIANHLGENGSRNEILSSIAQELATGLTYDRVIILLINENKKLEFAAGVLDDSLFAKMIRHEQFDVELESDDPAKIGNIYKHRRSVLIDDVQKHQQHLSPEGKKLFALSQSKSFLAVPIYTENQTLGVLMADNAVYDRNLSASDLKSAEACALQVGAVIQRLNAESEAKKSQKAVEALAHAASRFVPNDMIELLGCKSVTEVELGMAREHELAIVFTDIRGFTSLSETMSPREASAFLLSYYQNNGPSISKFGGMIDKLMGDGILALFKDPNEALKSAVDFQIQLRKYNETHRRGGDRTAIKTGIGLHFEKIRVASIGFQQHLSVTVVANGVNYTSRLDELNKKFGTDSLCSEQFYQKILDKDLVRFVACTQARGQKSTNNIYEILGHKSEQEIELAKEIEPVLIDIAHAIQEGFSGEARNLVEKAHQFNPLDPVVMTYRKRIEDFLKEAQINQSSSIFTKVG